MENRLLRTDRLRLARVKYYDMEHNGAELSPMDAYAFLENVKGNYVNVFDPTDGLPVLDRSMYANVTKDGEDYGNLLVHVSGTLDDGPCYVMDLISVRKMMGIDVITLEQLKQYVLMSKCFFVDRMGLIKGEKPSRRLAFLPTLVRDQKRMDEFKQYMDDHESLKRYVK